MRSLRSVDLAAIGGFLLLWGGSVGYLAWSGGDWVFPLISLGVFGAALSLLAWLTTLGAAAPAAQVARPGLESAVLLGFIAVYALVFLGWGLGAVREVFDEARREEALVLAVKLLVHVAAPAALLALLGARVAPLFSTGVSDWRFWLTLLVVGGAVIALLAVVSPSLRNAAALNPSAALLAWAVPASFAWVALEAGLCEEFLFRAVLQTRLSALAGSAWMGVAATSVLFGLAHAPGLYLRGGPEVDGWSTDLLQVIAFTIATLAPLSLTLGFIYARTKSLLLVVLLHASVDVLPNLADFIRTWG